MNLENVFKELNIKYKYRPVKLVLDMNNEIIGYLNSKMNFEELNKDEIRKIEKYLKDNGIKI